MKNVRSLRNICMFSCAILTIATAHIQASTTITNNSGYTITKIRAKCPGLAGTTIASATIAGNGASVQISTPPSCSGYLIVNLNNDNTKSHIWQNINISTPNLNFTKNKSNQSLQAGTGTSSAQASANAVDYATNLIEITNNSSYAVGNISCGSTSLVPQSVGYLKSNDFYIASLPTACSGPLKAYISADPNTVMVWSALGTLSTDQSLIFSTNPSTQSLQASIGNGKAIDHDAVAPTSVGVSTQAPTKVKYAIDPTTTSGWAVSNVSFTCTNPTGGTIVLSQVLITIADCSSATVAVTLIGQDAGTYSLGRVTLTPHTDNTITISKDSMGWLLVNGTRHDSTLFVAVPLPSSAPAPATTPAATTTTPTLPAAPAVPDTSLLPLAPPASAAITLLPLPITPSNLAALTASLIPPAPTPAAITMPMLPAPALAAKTTPMPTPPATIPTSATTSTYAMAPIPAPTTTITLPALPATPAAPTPPAPVANPPTPAPAPAPLPLPAPTSTTPPASAPTQAPTPTPAQTPAEIAAKKAADKAAARASAIASAVAQKNNAVTLAQSNLQAAQTALKTKKASGAKDTELKAAQNAIDDAQKKLAQEQAYQALGNAKDALDKANKATPKKTKAVLDKLQENLNALADKAIAAEQAYKKALAQ